MYERIAYHHGIDNLIWTWSTPEMDWYPGNIRVDMIGFDNYPGAYNYDCRVSVYLELRKIVGDHKMIHMS